MAGVARSGAGAQGQLHPGFVCWPRATCSAVAAQNRAEIRSCWAIECGHTGQDSSPDSPPMREVLRAGAAPEAVGTVAGGTGRGTSDDLTAPAIGALVGGPGWGPRRYAGVADAKPA